MECSEKLTIAVVSAILLAVAAYVLLYLYMVYKGFRSPAAQAPVPMPGWMDYIQAPSWFNSVKSPGVQGDDMGSTEDGVFAPIMWNKNLKKCFDAAGNKTKNGTKLQIYDCNGTAGQSFKYDSETMEIRGKGSNRCIDVNKNDQKNGNQVQVYDCNGGPSQRWERVGSAFQLADTTKCLDLFNGDTKNGTKIALWDCTDNAPNQSWRH